MIDLTYDKAVELAQNAVNDRGPGYIYVNTDYEACQTKGIQFKGAPCAYHHSDGPGCIVGHMLDQLGIDLKGPNLNDHGSIGDILDRNVLDGVLRATPKARRFLMSIQAEQDQGEPWGHALAASLDSGNSWTDTFDN